jgi:hypothetical protein
MAAVYYGQRLCGDIYDFVRVNPHRVVFGFFDVAGNLEKNRPIAVPLQKRFRAEACELLLTDDSNELEGLVQLWIALAVMTKSSTRSPTLTQVTRRVW